MISACRWPPWPWPGGWPIPNLSAAIVGASRPEQLEDTVKAADLVLGDETLQLIDDAPDDVSPAMASGAGSTFAALGKPNVDRWAKR
jgi:hypothetical protein